MPTRLTPLLTKRESLPQAVERELYALFTACYRHVDPRSFHADLQEKDWVLRLLDGDGRTRGFTTLKLYDLPIQGRRIRAVFNGNTLIEPEFWGEQTLTRAWSHFMAGLKQEAPEVPLYWYLICSGYRTYLFLPLFFRDFYPRHDRPTPPFEQALIDGLGGMKFPAEYREGIVRVSAPRECLREDLAEPAPHKLRNPHIRFFMERNEGYRRGDELVCVAEVSVENTRRFRRARRDPRAAQEALLRSYLARNAGTAFGREHRFDRIRTVDEFRDAVPIRTYEGFAPWIDRIVRGEPGVLTAEPVLGMEATSGSSAPVKYIPFTASLRREFQEAIGTWMADLYRHCPELGGGPHYWSLSPAPRWRERTPGGLTIGVEDDTDYLGPLERRVASWIMAVPRSVSRITDLDAHRQATVRHLARTPNLRFISVWSPTFLTRLVAQLPSGLRPADLWPKLRLISCWTSAGSARFVPELRRHFPGVEIQGKGLLATEGVISLPEMGRPAPTPAITSHLLEFIDEEGRSRLVDELDVGRCYTVVLTTGGGLVRYALGDRIEVTAPMAIQFVERTGNTSDLCGEKLSEAFVGRVLEEAGASFNVRGFLMLAPEDTCPPRYTLFVESREAEAFAREVERRLRESFHYDYCRRLGQLNAVEGVPVVEGAARYLEGCESLGQRLGNVKPAYLRREFGWRRRLTGREAG
jgi:hypothetical protein